MNSYKKEQLLQVMGQLPEEGYKTLEKTVFEKGNLHLPTFKAGCLAVCAAQGNYVWCEYLINTLKTDPTYEFTDETGLAPVDTAPINVAINFYKAQMHGNKNIAKARQMAGILSLMFEKCRAFPEAFDIDVMKAILFQAYSEGQKAEALEDLAAEGARHTKKQKQDEKK